MDHCCKSKSNNWEAISGLEKAKILPLSDKSKNVLMIGAFRRPCHLLLCIKPMAYFLIVEKSSVSISKYSQVFLSTSIDGRTQEKGRVMNGCECFDWYS